MSLQIMDLRQYTKKFIVEFIELYKSHPTLWQIKSREYRDRTKKAKAYELLVNKCREVEPGCDKDTVVKKINSLRTCYRKEFKKVQRYMHSGEEYKPKLWYYDLLSFLNEDTVLDSSIFLDEDTTNDFCATQCDPLTSQSESLSESARSSPVMFVPSDEAQTHCQPKKRQREDTEDEFDLLGRLYSNKLRKLERAQRIYAEKIINDALFEAQLGNLSRNCRLVTGSFGQYGVQNETRNTEIDLKTEYPADTADTSFVDP